MNIDTQQILSKLSDEKIANVVRARPTLGAEVVQTLIEIGSDTLREGHAITPRPIAKTHAEPRATARAPRAAAAAAPNFGKTRGPKRSPADIAETSKTLLEYIAMHPGLRVEEIATGIDSTVKVLLGPMAKLRKQKLVTTTGAARGMKYFPIATAAERSHDSEEGSETEEEGQEAEQEEGGEDEESSGDGAEQEEEAAE